MLLRMLRASEMLTFKANPFPLSLLFAIMARVWSFSVLHRNFHLSRLKIKDLGNSFGGSSRGWEN